MTAMAGYSRMIFSHPRATMFGVRYEFDIQCVLAHVWQGS